MLRQRQALGTLNQNGTSKQNTQQQQNQILKHQPIVKPTQSAVNNENNPPTNAAAKTQAVDFDFSIFKEEFSEFKQKIDTEKPIEDVEEEEEEEEKEEEYDDVEESDDDGDSEDSDDQNESDSDEEKDEEFRDQFQDICEKTDIMNVNMIESSSSPMVLDDTIKFQSKLDFSVEEEEEEIVDLEKYEETDEDARLRLESEERENCLKNCMEYKDDILSYMRQLEKEHRPKPNYMKKQSDITASMRSILVDWLVEVSDEYRLQPETLYLAVNFTDRFLSQMSVLRGKLQLVGTASMYIAAKYEEITPPDVSEFVFITDDTYTKKQVLRMEHLLLKILDFKMSMPTISWFLSHFLRFIKLGTSLNSPANKDLYNRIEHLSRYLCELTLIDADTFLPYLPSQVAASAIFLSFYTLGRPWTKQIAEIIGYNYDLSEIRSCILDVYKSMQQASIHPQQAIQEKYKQAKYDYASLIEPPQSLPAHLSTAQ